MTAFVRAAVIIIPYNINAFLENHFGRFGHAYAVSNKKTAMRNHIKFNEVKVNNGRN